MLTSIFSRLVITFGDYALPTRTLVEEVVIGLLLVIPLSIVLGHCTMRLAILPFPKIRPDVWNTLVRLFVADVLMEVLLPSITCLPLSTEPGYSWTHLAQSWGFYCQGTTFALTPTATGILFGTRLFFVSVGVYIGESYCPIALTGGIATGKSTVAHLLVHGTSQDQVSDGSVYLVDTDTIGHNVLLPNTPDSVYHQVVQVFGSEHDILVDNNNTTDTTTMENDDFPLIDRRKLGAIIFSSPPKRRRLNQMIHPRILYIMLKQVFIGTFCSSKDLVVCDVPLLYEGGIWLRSLFGLTIVVACDADLQLERLTRRNTDLTSQECQERIASQIPISTKVKLANFCITNNGSMQELEEQVERVREQVMHRVYGVGLSLLQLLIIIGGSVPVAVLSKLYSMKYGASTTNTNSDGDL